MKLGNHNVVKLDKYMPKELRHQMMRSWYIGDTDIELIKGLKIISKQYDDYRKAARAITLAGSGFISFMTDSHANSIFLRIKLKDGSYKTSFIVINRWHDNVSSLFNGSEVLDPSKDTMDILDMSAGSYPNAFVHVDIENLEDFLDLMKNMKGEEKDFVRMKKYFISRSNPKFWKQSK